MSRMKRTAAALILALLMAACAPVTRVFIEFEAPPTGAPASPAPTAEPIVFSDITVAEVGPDFAVIEWSVEPPAQGQVVYGLTAEYTDETSLETSLLGFHRQRISGLQPETTYHFAVVAIIPSPTGATTAMVPVG